MKLYKEQGINPLGGVSRWCCRCDLLRDVSVLQASIELRGATFIPGVVGDLSQRIPSCRF